MSLAGQSVAQVARVLVLVGLLLLLGRPHYHYVVALQDGSMQGAWWPWAQTVLVVAAFVAVALVGRPAHRPRGVTAAELIVALPLALVPTPQWAAWLGTGNALVSSGQSGFVQPLAVAWIGAVLIGAVTHARRGQRQVASDSLAAGPR